ncbi:hypothetical protein [Paraburkholderia sabiae]|uniref:hypothetical protein n=1 Tax=Paraburkholderia sabiae TaxID=273251 RepID=UPI001CC68D2D|nr:hypothetical protein [Paraburkholderia sabiae]
MANSTHFNNTTMHLKNEKLKKMKYFFYALTMATIAFDFYLGHGNPNKALLVFGWGSAMWLVAFLYICDFLLAIAGKNSLYMTKFYSEIKIDLFVSTISGATLCLLLALAPGSYSLSNLDVAFFGMPFLVYSIFTLAAASKIKIVGVKMSKRLVWTLYTLVMGFYIYFAYLLYEISHNQFSAAQSLWTQVTIVCAAIYAFFGSKFIKYVLEEQHFEVSPFILDLLANLKFSTGLYQDIANGANEWNKQVKIKKAEQRKEVSRRRKKKNK